MLHHRGIDIGKAAGEYLWGSAWGSAPDFAEGYLSYCRELLLVRQVVQGSEFREYCARRGLIRPATLHHNIWVGGPRMLQKIGWVEPVGTVEPTHTHNHMRTVTLWRSLLFSGTHERRRTRVRSRHELGKR